MREWRKAGRATWPSVLVTGKEVSKVQFRGKQVSPSWLQRGPSVPALPLYLCRAQSFPGGKPARVWPWPKSRAQHLGHWPNPLPALRVKRHILMVVKWGLRGDTFPRRSFLDARSWLSHLYFPPALPARVCLRALCLAFVANQAGFHPVLSLNTFPSLSLFIYGMG